MSVSQPVPSAWSAAGGQERPVGRAGPAGRRGGSGGGGFLPEDAIASLLALKQAALAGAPVLEAAVGRQAAAPRRTPRRRGVAEQFPAEAQDVLHVEVFPAGAGHGAAAGGRQMQAEAGLGGQAGPGSGGSAGRPRFWLRRRRFLRAVLRL